MGEETLSPFKELVTKLSEKCGDPSSLFGPADVRRLLDRIEDKEQQIAALEAQLELRNDELRALKYTVVATVGGVDYEGFPTCELNYLQRLRILVEKEAELEAQLADERARIDMICEERDKSSAEAEEEHGRVVEELRAEVRESYEDVEAKDAELREVREQYDNLRQWEQIAKHVSRQQAQRILALEAALRHVANLCHTAAIQHKCESCSGHAKIAEDALSPSSPQTASREESNG